MRRSDLFPYDNSGNITADGTNTYTWNNEGQLATVVVGGSTVGTYTYDYLGRRTKKVAGGTTTLYIYGPGGLLYGEYTTAGALNKEYVYLDAAPLVQIASGSPEVPTYLHVDHLGTPRYGTNSGGSSVWAWAADAFGVSAPTGSATVNLRMPGQYYDSESGLFYNWNRYYKPAIGRYISPDPIGLAGGDLNLFSYVGQSPAVWSDFAGLCPSYAPDCIEPLISDEVLLGAMSVTAAGQVPSAFARALALYRTTKAIQTSSAEPIAGPQCPSPALQNMLNSGAKLDRGGLTFAGRALQKHGSRENSAFPIPKGNPSALNQQGQKVLEGILNSNRQLTTPSNRFGGKDIYDIATGRGARFDANGQFRGFLEP